MVKAYVHFQDPIDLETISACFVPEDGVQIAPAFENAYQFKSDILKPLELRDILLTSLPERQIYFVNATRIDRCVFKPGIVPPAE